MTSLLPDEYIPGPGFGELAYEHAVNEIGYDDCHVHTQIMDGDIGQALAAWNQDVPVCYPHEPDFVQSSAYPGTEDLGPVAGLTHSAPVFFNPGQQPYPQFQAQQQVLPHNFQVPRQNPVIDHYDSYSECGSDVSSSCGSYGIPAVHDRSLLDTGRVRMRNGSAPPPIINFTCYPQNQQYQQSLVPQQLPAAASMASRSVWGNHPLSASYGDHPVSTSYPEPSPLGFSEELHFPKHKPLSSPRQSSRRRPSVVPVLAFGAINISGNNLGPYSPSSLPPLSPHSPQSQGSFSDSESPRSNASTPRSITSTPRSTTSTPRSSNDKKRSRTGAPHPLERERRVRPKVVAEKGALQCKGVNRKKNSRCRNAALMEYIGPRPLYCAEHITLDPDSYYSKCASTFHKVSGDGKGCREVVLKELEFCHKHYSQAIDIMLNGTQEGYLKARGQFERVSFLLAQLEAEAMAAKRTDPDLFQRKHKLIPKFMEMKKVLHKRLTEYEPSIKLEDPAITGSILSSSLNQPIVKEESSQDTGKDSSTLSTPSYSSADEICTYDEPSLMMQVEDRSQFAIF